MRPPALIFACTVDMTTLTLLLLAHLIAARLVYKRARAQGASPLIALWAGAGVYTVATITALTLLRFLGDAGVRHLLIDLF